MAVIANDFTVFASTNARVNLKKVLQFKAQVKDRMQVPLIWAGRGRRGPNAGLPGFQRGPDPDRWGNRRPHAGVHPLSKAALYLRGHGGVLRGRGLRGVPGGLLWSR